MKATGCCGFCENGRVVTIYRGEQEFTYYKVKPEDVNEIIEKTLLTGTVITRLCGKNEKGDIILTKENHPFYARQHKIALRNVGYIDPASMEDYMTRGGYAGFRRALEIGPERILEKWKYPVCVAARSCFSTAKNEDWGTTKKYAEVYCLQWR